MSTADIAKRLDTVRRELEHHPDQAVQTDTGVTATLESGLRVAVVDGAGRTLTTDLPVELGGGDTASTPGTLLRAAIASCEATALALVAAQEGIPLARIEVSVVSRTDRRGLLGVDDDGEGVIPGPLEVAIRFRIAAPGVDPARVRALVAGSGARSPVTSALRRSVPVRSEVHVEPAGDTNP